MTGGDGLSNTGTITSLSNIGKISGGNGLASPPPARAGRACRTPARSRH
jgi:hypothetical protein